MLKSQHTLRCPLEPHRLAELQTPPPHGKLKAVAYLLNEVWVRPNVEDW